MKLTTILSAVRSFLLTPITPKLVLRYLVILVLYPVIAVSFIGSFFVLAILEGYNFATNTLNWLFTD